MTYLELMITGNTIRTVPKQQEIIFSLEEDTIADTVSLITKLVRTDFPAVSCIVIREDAKAKAGDASIYGIGGHLKALLEDALNRPVVCARDFSETSLDEAVAGEIDRYTRHIEYYGLEEGKKELSRESLLTVGNGLFGLRGAFVEGRASENVYPGLYVSGGYNQLSGKVADKTVTNEDFVNMPNGQFLTFRVDGGPCLKPGKDMIRQVMRSLDLSNGVLTTEMIVDLDGKLLKVVSRKLADMMRRHYYCLSYEMTPLNFSGEIEVHSEIDGSVENQGVERYKDLPSKHLRTVKSWGGQNLIALNSITSQSDIEIATVARLTGADFSEADVRYEELPDKVIQRVSFGARQGKTYRIEKTVSIFTSLETKGNLMDKAVNEMRFIPGFAELQKESGEAWAALWKKADIAIKGDLLGQKLLRLHIYHLLVSASPINNLDLDFSMGARGLHGEAYRGHVFWDELFILPFYILHYPETARQMLKYRYNRLEAGRREARKEGYEGAMFPWQSGRDGDEQSQLLHLNPLTGKWGEDASRLQRHVGLAIAYNLLYYWGVTGDVEFMNQWGLEMLIEIARFWISKAVYNPATERYDIHKVMGPDEFHEAYPGCASPGLTNNAYTNIMVSWLFGELEELVASGQDGRFAAPLDKTGFTAAERKMMDVIRRRLSIGLNEDGIIAQHEGYFLLEEVDWQRYREKYGNIYRMDRLLKAEGKSADEYQVAKQPDVLMAFYCLGKERVTGVLEELGYFVPEDYMERNIQYYLSRTSHGSTLSRIIHGKLAEETGDKDLAWSLYMDALSSDYVDIQGGTTAEGIHTGVMGSTLIVAIDTFGGVDVTGEILKLNPSLPKSWQEMSFGITFKGVRYAFTITAKALTVTAKEEAAIIVKDRYIRLEPEKEYQVDLSKEAL